MNKMRVLLIGSGGREHAMAWKLASSPRCAKLFALPGSDGIARYAERLAGDPLDPRWVARAAKKNSIDLVVVGPEAPLAAGVADALAEAGIAVFGSKKASARLESSKIFSKQFMLRHSIPTAVFESFEDSAAAIKGLDRFGLPVVVKADGLAAGKGVQVCSTREEAAGCLREFMVDKKLGDSGSRVILEECLVGPEVTLMAFCDGKSFKTLPPSRDHKRLSDGDLGPNTGGMGAVAPVELSNDTLLRIEKEILQPILAGFKADRMEYCGILYVGLMLTPQGPKVLEFNVRFGDPETQVVLPLLESDLIDLAEACVRGELSKARLRVADKKSVSIVLASEGYPASPKTGRLIRGLDASSPPDTLIFHAGVKKDAEGWKTAGGRVLNVTGIGASVEEARNKAYEAVKGIQFEGMHFRTDIAAAKAAPSVLQS